MSGNYYRVTPEPEKVEGYGFKKVTATELTDIISRLTKPTYNSRVHQYEPDRTHNYRHVKSAPPPRTPMYCSKRFSIGSNPVNLLKDRRLTEKEMERMFRRVRKPTRSSRYARIDYEPSESGDDINARPYSGDAQRPLTASERKKAFYQMTRPTTASKGKDVKECHLCTDEDKEANQNLDLPFDFVHGDPRYVNKEEAETIVRRVGSPTRASTRGMMKCHREPPNFELLRKQSEYLPLVSGLERSRSISQIVNRLYYTKGSGHCRNYHGYTTQATQVSDFGQREKPFVF